MKRYDKPIWMFAAGLSALAGFVDAIGFIELGGFFVSFMSGNSTRLDVGLANAGAAAALAAGLIASFVGAVVLLLVAVLLGGAASLGAIGIGPVAPLLMAAAMGAENAVFEREGEVSIGLTYMTGTLVKLGQRLTDALLGGTSFGWLPYLLLWAGLAAGAAAGAAIHPRLGLGALWIAAAAAGFALMARRLPA